MRQERDALRATVARLEDDRTLVKSQLQIVLVAQSKASATISRLREALKDIAHSNADYLVLQARARAALRGAQEGKEHE